MTKLCLGGLFIFSFYITFQKRCLWAENQVLGSLELTCCNEVIELKGITLQMFTVCDVLLLTEKLQMKSLRSSNSVCWKCVTVGWRYMQSQPICSQLALQSFAHTCDIVKKKKKLLFTKYFHSNYGASRLWLGVAKFIQSGVDKGW